MHFLTLLTVCYQQIKHFITSNVLNGPTWWWESDKNRARNIRKKSNEKLQKRRFPAYFQHFQREKNDMTATCLGIPNTHLWAKNEKKLMKWWNLEKMPKSRFSSHIFGRKKSFYKIGLCHLLGIAISNQCANFMKKYKVQLEKFKICHFSGENRLFRGFLESSGNKNQLYWQFNHAWWWTLL